MKTLFEISDIFKEKKKVKKKTLKYDLLYGTNCLWRCLKCCIYEKIIRKHQDKAIAKYLNMMKQEKNGQLDANPVMVFIQFQSMNGPKKFRAAMNVSRKNRFCNWLMCSKDKKINSKYINGNIWPEIY